MVKLMRIWRVGGKDAVLTFLLIKQEGNRLSTIGIASHSGSMRYFLLAFGYGPHKMPNTALFHLIYDNGDW